jgi:hypothetical protein
VSSSSLHAHAALVQEALARVLQDRPAAAAPKDDHHQQQQQSQSHNSSSSNKKQSKKKGAPREFDFSRFSTRHIALQLSYEGDRYLGFATRVRRTEKSTDRSMDGVIIGSINGFATNGVVFLV